VVRQQRLTYWTRLNVDMLMLMALLDYRMRPIGDEQMMGLLMPRLRLNCDKMRQMLEQHWHKHYVMLLALGMVFWRLLDVERVLVLVLVLVRVVALEF